MSRAVLRVVQAGPLCSVQDGGRAGLMRFGVPGSGAMDRVALALANHAVGAALGAAAVEVSLGGIVLEVEEGALSVAVAGGGFVVEAAGERFGSWQRVSLREGDRLAIRRGPWGAWCCLAFAGRLEAEPWLGSAATHALSGLGGGAVGTGRRLVVVGAIVQALREMALSYPVVDAARREALAEARGVLVAEAAPVGRRRSSR